MIFCLTTCHDNRASNENNNLTITRGTNYIMVEEKLKSVLWRKCSLIMKFVVSENSPQNKINSLRNCTSKKRKFKTKNVR